MTDELIGKKIGGYEITEVLGRGGMATVYRAHQVSMNRTVALKVLPRHFLNDETYLQRFHREVKIISQLEHRNIVPVHDYGEFEGLPYIVMRYMSGGSVDDLLEHGPIDVETILSICEQIGPALDFAHSKEVLHRDLKPSNVLMDDNGGAYLTDFGIARLLSETGGTITTQGIVGTPSYMSPEQAQGQPMDGRSDLYSLGIMLFEMATGRRPFEGDTPYGIAVAQVTTPPPLPRSINPNLPPSVEDVILRAVRKPREERFETAAALVDALREAVASAATALYDTQPGFPRPPDPQPRTPPEPAPVLIPPPPGYGGPRPTGSAPATPMESLAIPRVKRRRRPNLMLNIAIGGAIGCGLLTLLVIIGLLIVQNTARQEEALRRTATAEAGDAGGAATEEAGSTSRPRLATNTPGARGTTAASATRPPVSATSASTPVTGVAPVGVRPDTALEGTPISVEGALVYFSERGGNYNIYRMNLPDRTEVQLTDHALADMYPAVSPDGSRIAFQSNRDGDFDIYIMSINGTNVRRLMQNSVDDRMPAWSPDGEWIVFASHVRGDGSSDLLRVRPDGSDPQVLMSDGSRNSHPRWASGGRYILFTAGQPTDARTWEIRRYDVETGEVAYLTLNEIKDWSPSVAPDGETVVYLTEGDGYAALATMDRGGEGSRVIHDDAGYEGPASFSPDGRFLAFSSDRSGRDELYLMSAEGENVLQLTERGGFGPVWVPNGE